MNISINQSAPAYWGGHNRRFRAWVVKRGDEYLSDNPIRIDGPSLNTPAGWSTKKRDAVRFTDYEAADWAVWNLGGGARVVRLVTWRRGS